jgi:phytoene synthase
VETLDLEAAYAACASVTRREARNFYYAFLSLPTLQRRAIYALYAFCREADDIVDAVAPSLGGEAASALGVLRRRLAAAAAGDPVVPRDIALADTIDRFGVDPDDLGDVLTGMELDLSLRRIGTMEDLDRYCYHAASAVGLSTLPILNNGTPPTDAMREAAVDLGLGMQYVNILRDVVEDLDRDRVYLPQDRLAHHDIDVSALRIGAVTEPIRSLLAEHARRSRNLLLSGRRLLPMLPRRARACPWILSELYSRILNRIIARDYDVFSGRVSLPKREKIALLLSSRWRRL